MECFPFWGGKSLANVSVEADAEWSSVRTGRETPLSIVTECMLGISDTKL